MSRLQNMDNAINHKGTIERIEGNSIYIRITQQSACAGCHAKSMCSVAEAKDKTIEISDTSGNYTIGEEVMITGKSSMGLQAVFIAFVLPLLIVVAVIAYGNQMQWKESIEALISLFFLCMYYLVLYFMRDRLKRKFIFTLKKLNQ